MSKVRNRDVEHLALMFKALSNPQRLRIFLKLAASSRPEECCATTIGTRCCVGDIGQDFDLAASTVSHHLKELRQAGLMKVERSGQKIRCWVSAETLRGLADFCEWARETGEPDGVAGSGGTSGRKGK